MQYNFNLYSQFVSTFYFSFSSAFNFFSFMLCGETMGSSPSKYDKHIKIAYKPTSKLNFWLTRLHFN